MFPGESKTPVGSSYTMESGCELPGSLSKNSLTLVNTSSGDSSSQVPVCGFGVGFGEDDTGRFPQYKSSDMILSWMVLSCATRG